MRRQPEGVARGSCAAADRWALFGHVEDPLGHLEVLLPRGEHHDPESRLAWPLGKITFFMVVSTTHLNMSARIH